MKVTLIRQTCIAGIDKSVGETIDVVDTLGAFLIRKEKAVIAVDKPAKKAKKK